MAYKESYCDPGEHNGPGEFHYTQSEARHTYPATGKFREKTRFLLVVYRICWYGSEKRLRSTLPVDIIGLRSAFAGQDLHGNDDHVFVQFRAVFCQARHKPLP